MAEQDQIVISLTEPEALVLFELLERLISQTDSDFSEGSAEWVVVCNLVASLEAKLVAPFREDYEHTLEEAREIVLRGRSV
jgi:hypothetical protein